MRGKNSKEETFEGVQVLCDWEITWVRGSSPLCNLSSGWDHHGSASDAWLEMLRNRAALA